MTATRVLQWATGTTGRFAPVHIITVVQAAPPGLLDLADIRANTGATT